MRTYLIRLSDDLALLRSFTGTKEVYDYEPLCSIFENINSEFRKLLNVTITLVILVPSVFRLHSLRQEPQILNRSMPVP